VRTRRLLLTSIWLVIGVSVFAEVKRANDACGSCHRAQASTQPDTQMGRAMQLPGDNPTLDAHPRLAFRSGPYSYAVVTRGGKSEYSVTDGTQTISLPILWTMGAQAQTWVLERNGKLYESLVSYYPTLNGLDITTGDEQLAPKTLDDAVGRLLTDDDQKTCFNCHATNAVVGQKLNLTSLRPGVTCEHCHAGAINHLDDVAQGDMSSAPSKLGKMTSEDLSNFCGQCHRTWELVVRGRWKGQSNVRFQPYRLANSKCFDGADSRISCLACHDPHVKVVRDSSFYDAKCLACHAPSLTSASANVSQAKSCPVAKSNCQSCHMPKVSLPNGHLQFTDHEIRVVKANEPYPN
jgi:hypothetical protein